MPSKAVVVAGVLADPPERVASAEPFYRALTLLGARVADEALIALRIALTGRTPGDEQVVALRTAIAAVRAGNAAARETYRALLETP